jgi:hypothetical protein
MTMSNKMVERVAATLDRMLPTDASQLRQQDMVHIARAVIMEIFDELEDIKP